jgi:GNAT superfamily N-acetyltransferase
VSSPDRPTYHEPARSYASLWFFAALLGAGFALDLALGGGIAHLAGWVLAFVLVVGLNFVILYAVRSQKSLRLTADEVRVGDETISRAEIVALTQLRDDDDLPVLGWPAGKPRRLRGLIVRLRNGQDVIVPSRFPDRLAAALEVEAAERRMPEIRAASRVDLRDLPEIDKRAEAVFRAAGYDLPELPMLPDDIERATAVFVAGRPPVGFVLIQVVDGLAHIDELAVIPRWMRQGIGSALLERACEWARRKGYPAITLTTYADVPWNAPFYRRHGFVELDELTPGLVALRTEEAELGLDAVGRRIVMRRAVGQPGDSPTGAARA